MQLAPSETEPLSRLVRCKRREVHSMPSSVREAEAAVDGRIAEPNSGEVTSVRCCETLKGVRPGDWRRDVRL